ncbi:30S ribosomal protein S14 [Actinoplanes sp. DH11]|uniref:30S ribosomal protein S14 n=1 Tax=Actinoplanes sp. DH11 TaxID=2857011 RepID=UPI001E631959|nr:30S ribosomal protein S14 [Actinoplanes sp. DH11]
MARRSLTEREKRRAELSARHFDRRTELKKQVLDPDTRADALRALARLPRDSSPSRRRSRDMIDGRPRGVLSHFGLSRVRFREMARRGELPGIRKASW